MQLQLFGKIKLLQEGEWLEPALKKPLCLLIYLAYAGAWVSRDQLAFLFWPNSEDKFARRNLRQLINRAKQLTPLNLEIEPGRLRWLPETDVRAFREAVATNNWRTASRLYKDDFLAVSLPADVGGFDAWVMLERESLQAAWQEACLNYALQLEEEAKFTEAAMQLKQILDKDALAEDVLQRYLKLAYLADQRDSALSQYERFRKKLETELDLEPLAETLHLVDTIRQASFAAPPAEQGSAKGQTQQVPLAILRPPKLVGRDKERQAVQVSSTAVVFIEGEAGAGKSRLMTELAPEALRIRCQEGLEQVPFYPLTSFIRATYESNDLSLLGHYLDDLTRLLPDISVGVPAPVLDSDLGRGRLLEALFRYCELVCSKDSEFRLIVDDLQWADEATLAFVNFVAAQQRLRILGAYRKYEQTKLLETSINQLKSAGNLTVITLEPLSEEAILTLLSQLMGTASGPPIFAKWLSENTGGNPMFALETLKSLFETEVLRSNEKGWHTSIDDITRDYSELKVPTAVADIIQRRVEQLSEASIRVLSAASVMQTGFTPKRLAQVTGLSEWASLEACEEAEAKGILQKDVFSHDLLRQSIYSSLSSVRKRLLHERVAELLTPEQNFALLAEHWRSADNLNAASENWQLAASRYLEVGLANEALSLLSYGLSFVDEADAAELHWALRIKIASCYKALADYDKAFKEAQIVLEHASSLTTLATALDIQANVFTQRGKLEEALTVVEKGIHYAEQSEDEASINNLKNSLALIYNYQGEFQKALDLIEPLLNRLRKAKPSAALANMLSNVAAMYDQLARHTEALPIHLEALEIARRLGFKSQQVDAALNLLYCYMDLGQAEKGIAPAQDALALGVFEGSNILESNLGVALLELGKLEQAAQHFKKVIKQSYNPTLKATAWARLAELYNAQNIAADDALREALGFAQQSEFDIAKARVIITTLNVGSERAKQAVEPLLSDLNYDALAPYLQKELEQARKNSKL